MDPLSIATGCASLVVTIGTLTLTITRFAQDVRSARADMATLQQELASLTALLSHLSSTFSSSSSSSSSPKSSAARLPDSLRRQIAGMVSNCAGVVDSLSTLLSKYAGGGRTRGAKWALSGRGDAARLRVSLEAHKGALEIALELVTIHGVRQVGVVAEGIAGDTRGIADDVRELRREIERLRGVVARAELSVDGQGEAEEETGREAILKKYLEDLESYADTVIGEEQEDGDETRSVENLAGVVHLDGEDRAEKRGVGIPVGVVELEGDNGRDSSVGRGSYPPYPSNAVELPGSPVPIHSAPVPPVPLLSRETPSLANTRSARLLIAVEFGNTQSAVAWAVVTGSEAKEDLVVDWPPGYYTRLAIPTEIYYDKSTQVCGWGADIAEALAPTGYLKAGVIKMRFLPIYLFQDEKRYVLSSDLPPRPLGKSAVDLCADYLSHLWVAVQQSLRKTLSESFVKRESREIHWAFTCPSAFPDSSKAALLAAIDRAGMLHSPEGISFIPTLEAVASYCSHYGELDDVVPNRDVVVVMDCGNDIVEITSFEIVQRYPFAIKRCTACSGGTCGSTALNRSFSNLLRAKINLMKLREGSRTAGVVYARAMMDFDKRIKHDFRNSGQKWAIDVNLDKDFPLAGIEEGYMTLTNAEILQCFEPVINMVFDLVRSQIADTKRLSKNVHSILVASPFSANTYLFDQIKSTFAAEVSRRVFRPMDAGSIVVKGALGRALDKLWYGS